MIHEVDEGIRRLLDAGGVPGSRGDLAFEAPTTEWTARRNAPAVNVFLYDIREDLTRRSSGETEVHDEDGELRGWRGPARWFELSYLVTAWTNRPQDEHRLLSEALACLVRAERLAPQWLTGSLAELGLAVGMQVAGPAPEGRAAPDVWSALGGELKPAITLKITAPLAGEWTPTGPLVTEGVLLRTEDQSQPTPSGARRLRYDGPSTAAGEGFSVSRDRPQPSVRRRRGEPIR
ncbi:DUF4255 domain-containing protein [Actinosynnema sp. NPDC047251]|uniref:Pvc16 N-terminal domain-containing protein n=1 Tax=Saccharothrix espanaensis (strain ATCC 51144 / DSM 44229 / JCM 9112 / NBRC 15066 / NRRL 15764) TaxID=1179773 RepID=K0JX59_SACES|nr:DUF4255 domain-containing protein [Saccharothrix espanaensis]CCH32470.1 hypothetical protein BN6_52050 [Saccharothrix espanaensis DSM 44229]